MTPTRLGADKNLSKSALEDWIEGTEAAIGPLTGIDVAQGGTVGTFDADGAGWTKRAIVTPDPEGAMNCQQGQAKVCSGRAYISGNVLKVLVCR